MSLAPWIARRPGWVLAGGLAVTVAALAVATTRLRIETDLAALLPHDAPAAADYRAFLKTFGGFEKVFVVVRAGSDSVDAGTLITAADRLAELLAASPEVASARSGLTEEDQAFFLGHVAPRATLLTDLPAAELGRRLEPAAIRARAAELRRLLTTPAGGAAAPLLAADPLGFADGLLESAHATLPLDPLSGAFLAPGRDAALVVLTPARAEIDPEGGRALAAATAAAAARVRRELGVPLRVDAGGGPLYAAQDEAILRADLSRTLSGSVLGVALVLLVGFEGVMVPGAILLAVTAGVVWTGAFAALAVGALTGVGVGFTAALVGLGVEYGVHGGARFQTARLAGAAPAAALARAFAEARPGIVSSALTTAVALAALALSHFRPLREMGIVLTAGVLATLVTTATLGAGALVLRHRFDRNAPYRRGVSNRRPGLWRTRAQPAVDALVGLAARRPRAVLAAALALSIAAAAGLSRLDFDADLRALRPADHPALAVERLLVERFGLGLDTATVVVRGKDLGEALARAARVKGALRRALGPAAEVSSPSDWLAAGAARDARLHRLAGLPLARAAGDLERELAAAGLNPRAFAPGLGALHALARGEDPGAPPPTVWPDWVRELVRAPAPGGGAAVAVNLRLPLGGERAARVAVLRALAPLGPGIAFASAPRVGEELRHLALADLRRSSAVALLLVAAVVLVSFRGRAGPSALSALPLALGCLWTFGLWGAAGRPIDLLCIATLPVLFGTGIDLGVHALHTARVHPQGVAGAARELGLAMTLTVVTTGIGFGSLASSRVPGLRNAGLIVAVGVVACLLATLTVLPALGALAPRRREGATPP
ncbi:MAG TPA: MMPL family transporter [Thermoanaerobaculia bacterium]|nr:MMPL family transporter [Thermoanaerobaculia bacterium]